MAKKKEHYGVLIIVGIVLLIAVAFIYFSGGTFGQAVSKPEKYDRCMQEAQNMKNKIMEAESTGKTISPSKYEKYGDLLAKCQSLLPKKPETYESCFSEYENKARDYKTHQDYPSAERIFQEGLKVCGEKFGKPAEAKPCPLCRECPACSTPTGSVPQIISSVLSYTNQGGQKAPYNLAGKDYVVELYYAKPGERVKMVVNGENLYCTPGTPTVTKDGTIIFVTGVELKSAERSDVQFLMLSPTTSVPKECPSCPTPTHIMSVGERQTWVVNRVEYQVELLVVSETSGSKFKLNGEMTEPLKRGEGYNMNDGSMFVITAIKGSQVEAAILPFSVLLR